MSDFRPNFEDEAFVQGYLDHGPPAFMPGHAGVLQMTGVLLREQAPRDARVLVVGAGGGLEIRVLARMEPDFRFVGVDPAPRMLELARTVIGSSSSRSWTTTSCSTESSIRSSSRVCACS